MVKKPKGIINTFDVMIVYSEGQAISASTESTTPFAQNSRNESYNLVYSYFLDTCSRAGLSTALTTSADVAGPGLCKSYWTHKNGSWTKNTGLAYSKTIFDKLSPTNSLYKNERDMLFSTPQIRPFNNPKLYALCFDKQKTHDKFPHFAIPTVSIESNTIKGVTKSLQLLKAKLARRPGALFDDIVVIKNRYGAGGRGVYKFSTNMTREIAECIGKYKKMSFIVQPFVHFDRGLSIRGLTITADIRLVYLGGKIVQTYIRVPKPGSFICNEHKGGILKYIPKSDIPKKVIRAAKGITQILGEYPSLFSLDFIISNEGGVYLLEANTGPGLDWDTTRQENEREAKKLIRMVVSELATRAKSQNQVQIPHPAVQIT